MPRILEIEGDLVREVNREVVSQARLADFLPNIESRPPLTLGLLPKTAIMIRWDESDPRQKVARFLCEQVPQIRSARYNNRRYRIAVPWTYYVMEFRTAGNPEEGGQIWQPLAARIYWAREQVTGFDSQIGTALVPNCNSQGSICYGSTGVPVTLPLGVRVDRLVSEFWDTIFTHDSGAGSPYQRVTGSTTWSRWHRETAAHGMDAAWNMPEWEQNGQTPHIRMMPVQQVLALPTVAPVIETEGVIPEAPPVMTFGRAEEWLRNLSAENRYRLRTAMENMVADDPAVVVAPAVPADDADDPGELIADGE